MSIESVQALLIASLAVVPGAIYTWVFERNDGATGDRPAERLLRFVAISLLLSLVSTLPIGYWFYSTNYVTGALQRGEVSVWILYTCLGSVAIIPAILGWAAACWVEKGWYGASILASKNRRPRAWDHIFNGQSWSGRIRIQTTDGKWIIGLWMDGSSKNDLPGSFAAGYPYDQDLYFVDTYRVNQEDGSPVVTDGEWHLTGIATLVQWQNVVLAEFMQTSERDGQSAK